MTDIEPTRNFSTGVTDAYYVETEGAVRYHLNRSCRGLKRAEAEIKRTEVELIRSNGTITLTKKGRNLCRICAPIENND